MTTAREVRAYTRTAEARHGVRRRSVGDLYMYGAMAVIAAAELVGVVSAPNHDVGGALGGAATTFWVLRADAIGVPAALLFVLCAWLFDYARRIGPVAVTLPQAQWWLPLPIDRRGLVLPGFVTSLSVPVAGGAILAALVSIGVGGLGTPGATLLAALAVAGLVALIYAAAAGAQFLTAPIVWLDRAVRAFLPLALVATLIAIALGTPLTWFVWLPTGWPLLAAQGAGWPTAVLLLAAALAVTLVYWQLPRLAGHQLRDSVAAVGRLTAATLSMEGGGGIRTQELPMRRMPRHPDRKPRTSPVSGPRRRFVLTHLRVWWRTPGQPSQAVFYALLPVTLIAMPYLNYRAVLVIAVALCALRAVSLSGSLARLLADNPALGRLFPIGRRDETRLSSVLPAVVLLPWCAVCFGLLAVVGAAPADWVWLAIPVGVGLSGAAVRSGTRPDTDWSAPLISTPAGGLSSGWVLHAMHGRMTGLLVLAPALIALAVGGLTVFAVCTQVVIAVWAWWWSTR